MEPGSGGSEPGGFNTGGNDFGYVSDFGFDHDHHDGHGDHSHGDHDHGHGDHFGEDAGGDHDQDQGQNQGQNNGLKSLIARLLGLDKDAGALGAGEAGGEAAAQTAGDSGQTPSQSVMYSNALAGISLSEAFKGIRVTPNFLYLCLFSGFTFWLFVVYWIRHNEPLANQVLGTGPMHTRSVVDDRRLLNSVKDAMPFRTSSSFGDIYTPNTPHVPAVQPMDHALMMGMNNAKPLAAHMSSGAGPQSLQQKLLSTAAQQPYQMRTATANFANQYVNQAVRQGAGQVYPMPAQTQQYAPMQQFPRQSYQMPAVRNQQYSQYAGAYPNTIATAGTYYGGQAATGGQVMVPQALPPLMEAPNGMGPALQQFGSASTVDNQVPRLRTLISR